MNWRWRSVLFVLSAAAILALLVFVVSCGGGGGGGQPSQGTIQNPVPSIASISPTYVPAGSSPQTLTLNGSGFVASSSVTFNSAAHPATLVSSQQLTTSLSQSDVANPGNYPVAVTNPAPGGGMSASTTFSVWSVFGSKTTGISFAYPQFGSSTQVVETQQSNGWISLDIYGWSSNEQQLARVVYIDVSPPVSGTSLQQWFESSVDINGILMASGTYQEEQLSDGRSVLVLTNSIPDQYLQLGGLLDEMYALTPDGKYALALGQGQTMQLSDYGYDSTVLLEILNTMTSN